MVQKHGSSVVRLVPGVVTAPAVKKEFFRDDRVELSELGLQKHPRHAGRKGTVLGLGRYPSSVRLTWDGSSNPVALFWDYLQLVARAGVGVADPVSGNPAEAAVESPPSAAGEGQEPLSGSGAHAAATGGKPAQERVKA